MLDAIRAEWFECRWARGFGDEKRRWDAAETASDAATLIAEWLRGETAYNPWYISPGPDPETLDEPGLAGLLADLNDYGFLTTVSQPAWLGRTRHSGWTLVRQRAAVAFLLDAERRDFLVQAVRAAGLCAEAMYPLVSDVDVPDVRPKRLRDVRPGDHSVPVVVYAGDRVSTDFGWYSLELVADMCQPPCTGLFDALSGLAHVVAWDPEWGRREPLWTALRDVVSIWGPCV